MSKSNFKFNDKGLKKLQKKLNTYSKKSENLNGQKVAFSELFNSNFMTQYTSFDTINNFFEASPFVIENEKDLEKVDEIKLDSYVRQSSSFDSWREMLNKASEKYIAKQLGF